MDDNSTVWLFIALSRSPYYVTKVMALDHIINFMGFHCVMVKMVLCYSWPAKIDIMLQKLLQNVLFHHFEQQCICNEFLKCAM